MLLATARIILFTGLGCYLLLLFVAVFLADRIIFQPQPSTYNDTPEILKLSTADGKRISALYLPNPLARYTILYSHGNAEDMGDDRPILESIRSAGFSVFAYDYHGYGTSEGVPSEKVIYADVDAAYDYLTATLRVPPDQIISFGRSVGTGAAVDLAARRPVAALVVQSGFTSAFRVLTPVPLIPFDKFRNLEKIERVRCPILFMHGTADQVIPFQHGLKLYQRAPGPKVFLWVEGAHHNDFEPIAGRRFFSALTGFAGSLALKTQEGN